MSTQPTVENPPLSVEEFAGLPEEEGSRLELSGGRVVREPAPGLRHSEVAGRVYRLLWRAGERTGGGLAVFDAAFTLSEHPPTVRVPDVAFLSSDRVPEGGLPDGFGDGAPDLAVEVVSASNRASELQRKALEFLDAGGRLVWVVDPAEQTVTIYRSRSDIRILGSGEVLDGGDGLPDFRVSVDALFG